MIRINPQFTSNKVVITEQNKSQKIENSIENPIAQKTSISAVTPDYSVKTPLAFALFFM